MESFLRDESRYTRYLASVPVVSMETRVMEMPLVASLSGEKTLSFRLRRRVKFL